MRPNFLLSVLLGATVVLTALFWLKQRSASSEQRQSVAGASENVAPTEAAGSIADKRASRQASGPQSILSMRKDHTQADAVSGPGAESSAAPTATDEYIEKRVGELMDLAMDDQPASLHQILSELTNSNPMIRKAAIEAVKDFGSSDAIPKLKELIANTDDRREKAELKEAVEFLETPSLANASPHPDVPRVVTPATIAPSVWKKRLQATPSNPRT